MKEASSKFPFDFVAVGCGWRKRTEGEIGCSLCCAQSVLSFFHEKLSYTHFRVVKAEAIKAQGSTLGPLIVFKPMRVHSLRFKGLILSSCWARASSLHVVKINILEVITKWVDGELTVIVTIEQEVAM